MNATINAAPEERRPAEAELLDVQRVAALLGCSVRHVYRMADEGWMPEPVRLRGLVRWRRAEISQWIERGCRPVRPKGGE